MSRAKRRERGGGVCTDDYALGTDYDSSALAALSKGEYLAADGERRFWYFEADLPSAPGDGSDSADDEPPGGVRAGLYAR